MKTTLASLLVVLLLTITQLSAQQKITVEAQNDDISYNLDLKAVASIFGDSKDLEEFEMKLNDYDSQISNLDLNNDGEVDYLRVIESSENNVHVVVIQAVLDRDVFQDVASILVERNSSNRTYVQVIGDPYMYGSNYIIEPVYYHTPSIYSFFWGRNYRTWYSPYYWGYYPTYYRNRSPFAVNIYLSNIHTHINRRYDYRYSTRRTNDYYNRVYGSVSRNDYYRVHPDRSFSKRNDKVVNKYDFERNNRTESSRRTNSYNSNSNGSRYRSNSSSSRNTSPTWNGGGAIQRSSSTTNGSRSTSVRSNSNTNSVSRPVQTNSRTGNSRQSTVTDQNTRTTNTYTAPKSTTRTDNSRKTTSTENTTSRQSTSTVAPKTSTPSRSTESRTSTKETTTKSNSSSRR